MSYLKDNILTSSQNPRIQRVLKLKKRTERDELGLFLVEGYRELKRAIEAGQQIEEIFICPDLFLGSNEQALLQATNAPIIECHRHLFDRISYRDRPDGLLGVARQRHLKLEDLKIEKKDPFFLILDQIEKPGNLGTILRSADGAGVDAILLSDCITDIHNPNTVRASVGACFSMKIVEDSSEAIRKFLNEKKIPVITATPHAKSVYSQTDLKGSLAIVLGSEQYGLGENWLKAASSSVTIPMLGRSDSLNVASAAVLLMYEVLRQRSYA